MNKHLDIAQRVLDPGGEDSLEPSLKQYLNEAAAMVQHAGGQLRSRQAVVCLIQQWKIKYPSRSPVL